MHVLQIAKGCSLLSKGKQHLEYWGWFSKKKLGGKVCISSLKFCQSMLLPCSCQHCHVPQAPHCIWLHSAARFSLLMEKYHPDRVTIGYIKRAISQFFLCATVDGVECQWPLQQGLKSHRSAVKALNMRHTSPYCILLYTVLWCSMKPADKICFV